MAPVSLYCGKVMHARLRPRAHRFRYRVFSVLLDVDRLAEADRVSRLFSVDRFNLLSFHAKDHGPCDGTPIRAHVRRLLQDAGLPPEAGRILLLCYPRVLGFAFNPLSVYYVHRADGTLSAVLYEVRNTFGERHTYVAPVAGAQPEAIRQSAIKTFHVSPFLALGLRYRFRLSAPGEELRLLILAEDGAGPVLTAGFTATRRDLTAGAILSAFMAMPLMTLKVVAGIHWEALLLWLKGLRIHPHPRRAGPDEPLSAPGEARP